ncbi:hypothetical protein [Priestia endophytica]|jgi:hypothetical protein|uniref:hypothetical protein n=1 Tax=Priestia endophytica TaxID=135735 RepID=UPI00124CDBEF|nr:hypothetical protein [Priestia endophytica]KAB2488188.1 hypothetical protein F8155_25230 [Priestia endophytica]MBG9812164.1 hypothetical protein [Priestia endophytica]MBG9812346.1 hypothetical protein [Priestia endophytica]MBG9812362.1 hypothetical protein [Priestia endophytica]MBG9812446.1 hypothetical protein [Priestia endophytica]
MIDLLNQMNDLSLGAADGMGGLIESGKSILKWFQRLGIICAAIAFGVGGYLLMLGGDRGRQKCIAWFIGGAVGLVIVMGALGIAQGVDSNIKFGG